MSHRIYDDKGFCDRKNITGPDACRRCHGDGIEPRNTYARCETCDGSGYAPRPEADGGDHRGGDRPDVDRHDEVK